MRSMLILASTAILFSACAQGCALAEGLYSAVVHNSGAPSRAERDQIDQREAELLRELPRRRMVVLPVAVLGRGTRFDTSTAMAIADGLRRNGISGAVPATTEVRLPFQPQPNEAAIFWSRFKALAAHVASHPRTDADYVLLVDVFGAPDDGSVGAVHAMVVTGKGEMAYSGLWNSHQELYREIVPHSLDDAARMVVTDLTRKSALAHASAR